MMAERKTPSGATSQVESWKAWAELGNKVSAGKGKSIEVFLVTLHFLDHEG